HAQHQIRRGQRSCRVVGEGHSRGSIILVRVVTRAAQSRWPPQLETEFSKFLSRGWGERHPGIGIGRLSDNVTDHEFSGGFTDLRRTGPLRRSVFITQNPLSANDL